MRKRVYGDRYQETGESHSGGTGTVIICSDPNLDRKVAIKFLQQDRDTRRIFDEIAALQRIRSKHVVQIYDIVIEKPGNRVGLVQEYLDGEDLRAFAKGQPTPDSYLRTIYQVASGLEDIHSLSITHRDIKPNNIKIDSEGIVKIFDFGLARDDEHAVTVGLRGTLGYAAPELFASGYVAFSPATDVYAFAATALFCGEGNLPEELYENPPNPEAWKAQGGFSKLHTKVPSAVISILDACLSSKATDRPAISEVRTLLATHLVRNSHRAVLVNVGDGKTYNCDSAQRTVRLARPPTEAISISYDGLFFRISEVSGEVFLNNIRAKRGGVMQGSGVIAIGAATSRNRDFITIDISHPEVVF